MATRFWKRKADDKLNKLEEGIAHAISDYERASSDNKAETRDLFIDSVKEIEVTHKGKKKNYCFNRRSIFMLKSFIKSPKKNYP